MLSKLHYASLSNYSPRGSNVLSKHSQDVCGWVKTGDSSLIKGAFKYFDEQTTSLFSPFLNANTILIPIPRSSLLKDGSVWPSYIIANLIVEQGYGKEVLTCLQRVKAVPKSSNNSSADSRTPVQEHLNSLTVVPEIINATQITLVDDVLTLGRTSFACAHKLHQAYPDLEIRLFVLLRTRGLEPNIDKFIDPSIGEITFNATTGKTSRIDRNLGSN